MKNLANKNVLPIKPYVPGKPIDEVKREYGLTDVIKLASNENPLGPSKKALERVQEVLHTTNIYPDGYCFNLRTVMAKKFDLDINNFVFGDGTDEVLGLLFLAFVSSGDEVIYGVPSFVEYERYNQLVGGEHIKVSLTEDYKYDLKEIKEKITDRTKMIMICNPNNPTGTIVSREEVEKFLEGIPETVLVVFDEAYFEYAMDFGEYPDSLEYQRRGMKNIITLRTFSKAYGLAGFRVGYGIACEEIIDILERVRAPFNVTTLSQAAAIGALEDDEHLKNSIDINSEGRDYIYRELEDMGLKVVKSYTNFIYFLVDRDASGIFEDLLKKGIIVRVVGEKVIRVSVGSMVENREFIKVFKEVI